MRTSPQARRIALAALLAVFLLRIGLTWPVFNDTFDESGHIRNGLEILQRHSFTLEAEQPPLGALVVAALPYFVAGLRLNHANELWGQGAWATREVAYFWRTLALARAGNLLFAVLLFSFVYLWAQRLYGPTAGLAACAVATCCPNLIAHAGLATLDIGGAATVLMGAFFLWRWVEQPAWRSGLAAGAACGVAVATKISAAFFLPVLAVLFCLVARRGPRLEGEMAARWPPWRQAAWLAGVMAVVVWAGYGFQVGAMAPPGHRYISPFYMGEPPGLPGAAVRTMGTWPLPAHKVVQGVIEVFSHNQVGHPAYLLGRVSSHGWWYYFPLAVAFKGTLPMLGLAAMGVWLGWRRSKFPLLAGGVILALAMSSNLNIGVRHVLSLFPFLAILGSPVFLAAGRRTRLAGTALLLWHAGESVAAHPDYLAYFNELGRGREERLLADSNLDWGQDLARLGRWMEQNRVESLRLHYFGRSSPEKLGVRRRPLGASQPERGWIAISLTHLAGASGEPADPAWLRDRKPEARAGKSIWIYRVE